MANCCNNLLVITGPAKERRQLARLWTDGRPVFNRILPQPDPFTDGDLAQLRANMNDSQPGGQSLLDPVCDNGWWWRTLNWGTASDIGGRSDPADVQEREDTVTIDFMTDSCPPLPIIEAMSRLYPSLAFHLKYFEIGCCQAGEGRFVAGDGRGEGYAPGSPEYRRLASDFGYMDEANEEQEELPGD